MTLRITCSVFGCSRYRTIKNPEVDFIYVHICKKHWAELPRKYRKLSNRVQAIRNKHPTRRNSIRCKRVWRKCIKKANINNFGI